MMLLAKCDMSEALAVYEARRAEWRAAVQQLRRYADLPEGTVEFDRADAAAVVAWIEAQDQTADRLVDAAAKAPRALAGQVLALLRGRGRDEVTDVLWTLHARARDGGSLPAADLRVLVAQLEEVAELCEAQLGGRTAGVGTPVEGSVGGPVPPADPGPATRRERCREPGCGSYAVMGWRCAVHAVFPAEVAVAIRAEETSWRNCAHRADFASAAEHSRDCPVHGQDAEIGSGLADRLDFRPGGA